MQLELCLDREEDLYSLTMSSALAMSLQSWSAVAGTSLGSTTASTLKMLESSAL